MDAQLASDLFARNLLAAANERGMTGPDLARAASLPVREVAWILDGRVEPCARARQSLARAVNQTPGQLMAETA